MDLEVPVNNNYCAQKLLQDCLKTEDCKRCEFYLGEEEFLCKIGRPYEWLLNVDKA